ncbi:putative Ig domain-containing protein [Ensifer adhaerens]|uniref:putative Ig domain-containing protein n=1 Tax=Ensifer adhaerens TaxID=106592 RepID=UPI001569FB2E|nr:putative Ig domain-containing protein [Ensifer adhaerens]
MPSNTPLIYTNNGDGAPFDTFIVKDDNAVPVTFNVTINPSASPLTVTPSNVATPAIGTSYNQTLSTSGGTGPYTYSLVAGSNLPPGLTLSSAGVISGTPTGSGPYNFTVRVVDSTTPTPHTRDKAYSVLIAAPVINVTPDSPPDGGVGTAYSVQFSATGGTPGYTYTRDSGSLPAGLSLSGSGLLSGTPSAVGSSTFKLKVQDSTTISTGGVHFLLQDVTVTINAVPPVVLTPTTGTALTAGAVGSSYSNASISATGGAGTITYAVTSGSLPAGLALNTSTGAITGTPTAGALGTTNFTVTATAAAAGSAAASYSITITAPPLVLAPLGGPLTSGTAGVAYSTSISATGGVGTVTYALTAGALPPGLTMNTSTGAISGTPTAIGTFNFSITATAATSGSVAEAYQIAIVGPPLNLSPASGTALTGGVVGSAYTDTSISASSPLGGVTFSASGLPDGLTINALTGEITGTPTAAALGTTSVDVEVMSMFGNVEQATYPITIVAPSVVLTPTTGTALTAGVVGSSYSNTSISATGGVGTITYAVTSGSLPAGLALNTSTGAITGTPTAGALGTTNFTVTATAATTGSAAASYSITITAPSVVLTPATGSALSTGTVGVAYSDTSISASGGVGTIGYAVTSGALPAGLSLNASTAAITGTPTAGGFGTATFTVTATAATSGSAAASYTIAVGATAVVLTPASGSALSAGTVGAVYSDTSISASGGVGTIGYAVTSGALPAGLSLNASTAAITGTPTAGGFGTATFTVTATAATSGSAAASYTIAVGATAVVLTPASGSALSAGTVGAVYSDTSISASGGVGTIGYAVTAGALPGGLNLNASTGAISGTPTTSGDFSVTITATDTVGTSGSAGYSLKIKPPEVTFVFTPPGGALDEAMAGEDYSQSITAKGGTGALIYSIVSGSLPKGLVLNISTGELTGPLSVDAAGTHSFAIQVRDGTGATGKATFTLPVKRRTATVVNLIVDVPAGGTPANVYLNRGATGGPFTGAELAFVEPANAGTATIIRGEVAAVGAATAPAGWYLQFKPDPAYSGQVQVGYRLISALGTSNTGVVTYRLALDADRVAEDIDALVRGFVETRQNMISSAIKVPGLLERRQMEAATDPVTARMMPSQDGMEGSVSTGLRQIEAARDNADGVSAAASSPFNIWIDGTFLVHNRDNNDGRWGSFAMINAGADYLLTEKALVGLSFHYDRMSDPSDEDAELTGNGWLAGPYASFEIARNIFWNASLRYGGSSNDIDTAFWDGTFNTTRWLADTALEGQWDIDEATTFTPKLRILYFSESVDDYMVRNDAGETVDIGGFDEEQFRVSLGAEIARSFTLENGTQMTPKLGLTGGYSGLDGSGAFGSLTAGVSWQTADLWMLDLSLLLNIADGGETSTGGRVRTAKQF